MYCIIHENNRDMSNKFNEIRNAIKMINKTTSSVVAMTEGVMNKN